MAYPLQMQLQQPQGLSTGAKLAIAAGILVVLYFLFKNSVDAYIAGLKSPSPINSSIPTPQPLPSPAPPASLAPKYPTKWTCAQDIDVPIRREDNANNDISCLSENAKDCLWGDCNEKLRAYSLPENVNKVRPLVCGTMHESIYGETGYTRPIHWCYKGNLQVPKL